VAGIAALVVFALISTGTPGPNNLMLWASGAEFGLRRALPHVLGTAIGVGLIAVAVAAGVGAIVAGIPALATAMKLAGSAYLLYLAWQVAGAHALRPGAVAQPLTLIQAAAFQLVNVKVWIFALGAMTAFRPIDLPVLQGTVLVIAVMVLTTLPTAALWAAAGGALARFLATSGRQRAVSLVLGLLLALTVVDVWL
jgi:threonine/homoserine/homoserine lactone efflux protein